MHSLLETYLEEVASRLRVLPRAKREEELRELRQHLIRLDADYRGQGLTEDEAARAALGHFGSSELLGWQMTRAWRRGLFLQARLGVVGTALVAGLLLYLPTLISHEVLPNQAMGHGRILVHFIPLPLTVAWVVMVGIIVGCRTAGGTLRASMVSALLAAAISNMFGPFLAWPVGPGMPHLLLMPLGTPGYVGFLFRSLLLGLAFAAALMEPAALLGRAWASRHHA